MEFSRYKLRFHDGHIRVVCAPAAALVPPGVDLFGEEAAPALAAAAPLIDWLRAMEPGVPIRAILVDRDGGRVQISIDERIEVPGSTSEKLRPRMFRAEGPLAEELLALATPIDEALARAVPAIIARRA
jgi:hypothetical protein